MTFYEAVTAFVAADPDLPAALGKLYASRLPRNSKGYVFADPSTAMRMVSGAGEPPTHDGGASPWVHARIEFTVWSASVKKCEQAVALLRSKLAGFNGNLGGTVRVVVQAFNGPRDVFDDQNMLSGIQLDLMCLVNTSTVS